MGDVRINGYRRYCSINLVRRHMPNYAWTCGACSHRNESPFETCSYCECPASSSLKQREAYRAATAEGQVKLARKPEAEFVTLETYQRVVRIRRTVVGYFISGGVASLALTYLTHQYWDLSTTKLGAAVVMWLGVALTFGPIAVFLSRLRCPRCSQSWLGQNHSNGRDGAFILWAFASWRSCAHCGLSVLAKPAIKMPSNPSIKGTSPGEPGAAPHVKR